MLTLKLDSGATLEVDVLVWAIGRRPMTHEIGLEAVGVQTDAKGFVKTDAFENTSVEGVYAVGDCAGKRLLTPVALAAGRRLSCVPAPFLTHARLPAYLRSYADRRPPFCTPAAGACSAPPSSRTLSSTTTSSPRASLLPLVLPDH